MDYMAHLVAAIRLGYLTNKRRVFVRVNVTSLKILLKLLDLGCIVGLKFHKDNIVCVFLRYNRPGRPTLKNLVLLSKRSKRIYCGLNYFEYYGSLYIYGTYGLFLFSTTRGLLWHPEAIYRHIGGEMILYLN